jgi:hypothetical protein
MDYKLCTYKQSQWLSKFYHNSGAYHERQVMMNSKIWRKEMNHLYCCWGDPSPKFLEIQSSPGPNPGPTTLQLEQKTNKWITNGPDIKI